MNGIKTRIHGHRGARGRRPENTLAAMDYAVEVGADGLEVDLCVSSDDVVVVHHDLAISPVLARHPALGRDFSPQPIRSLAFSAIRRFDIGEADPLSHYAAGFPQQVPSPGQTVPTLDELIHHVNAKASPDLVFNLELKGSPDEPDLVPEPARYVDLVIDLLERHDIIDRCYLQSFDWRLVRLARERSGGLLTGVLTDGQPDADPLVPDTADCGLWSDDLVLADFDGSVPHMVAASGAAVWSANFRDLDEAAIAAARSLGLSVYVWTVNDIGDMQRMIDLGVDVITTDYPARLRDLLNR